MAFAIAAAMTGSGLGSGIAPIGTQFASHDCASLHAARSSGAAAINVALASTSSKAFGRLAYSLLLHR